MSTLHRGQGSCVASSTSVRDIAAPQWEQNFAPLNMVAKQDGQATVANAAPQCSQRVASLAAGAPHIGQLSDSTAMRTFSHPAAYSQARIA
jgi:hypothetical protein